MKDKRPERIELNGKFSIIYCTFKHQSRSVIYSPFTSESMLCDISVVELLERLSHADCMTGEVDSYVKKRPESALGVIKELLSMQILLPAKD